MHTVVVQFHYKSLEKASKKSPKSCYTFFLLNVLPKYFLFPLTKTLQSWEQLKLTPPPAPLTLTYISRRGPIAALASLVPPPQSPGCMSTKWKQTWGPLTEWFISRLILNQIAPFWSQNVQNKLYFSILY